MAPSNSSEDTIKYLLLVMNNSEGFKPNYHEICVKAGINNANNAQKKFKKIVEDGGFNLVNGAVTHPNAAVDLFGAAATPGAPKTPKKTTTKKASTPGSKKRKISETKAEEVEDVKTKVEEVDEDVEAADDK